MNCRGFNALTIGLIASVLSSVSVADASTIRVYYGTKNASGSQGIYTGTLDTQSGTLSAPVLAAEAQNPGFVAVSHTGQHLYSVASGKAGHWIVSYAIDKNTGKLTELNRQETGGANPCHVSVGPSNRYVVFANYTGGSCGMMPIAADGTLKPRSSFFQHQGGSGVNQKRQSGPHPHSARTAPGGDFVMVPDLGQDKVRIYRVASDAPRMTLNSEPFASSPPGGGPRHVTFSRDGRWMYSNNELTSSVTAYELELSSGATKSLQTISTLPQSFAGNNSTAEILVHPSGRFLYCSNRGHNSIAAFEIDANTGRLSPIGHTSSGGDTPRNFGITPGGRFVVAANQASDDVVVLKVNEDTGELTPTGSRIKVPHCICVRFVNHGGSQ